MLDFQSNSAESNKLGLPIGRHTCSAPCGAVLRWRGFEFRIRIAVVLNVNVIASVLLLIPSGVKFTEVSPGGDRTH